MRHGDTIDIETAHVVCNEMLRNYRPQEKPRPVIWSLAKADEALMDWVRTDKAARNYNRCHRRLIHLVCLEDEVKCLLVVPLPYPTRPNDYGMYIHDIYAPYDYRPGMTFSVGAHFVILGDKDIISARHPDNKALIESGEITLYKNLSAFKDNAHADEIHLFQIAHVLEQYAFSPCATIKQRPRLIKAINRDKPPDPLLQREWPAIEIISLRRPELAKRPEHTGRKIGIRYSVTEHLRRQPTRAGVKLITIGEHWRGPKDAPVKPKVEKIYKVTR